MKNALQKLIDHKNLSQEETHLLFDAFFDDKISDIEMSAFLTALRIKGESIDELTGALLSIRSHAETLNAPNGTIDCCGTGGDGKHSLNISTAVSFVVAACGVPVAKHGNRAASSKSGAADVLQALGVNLDASKSIQEKALQEHNICFLMAPHYHPALKKARDIRKALGFKTLFNLIGPLSNPAHVKKQLIGVFDTAWCVPLCQTLKNLGHSDAWVVHSDDGYDEISVFAPTQIAQLKNGNVSTITFDPKELNIPNYDPDDLTGGDATYNASALNNLFNGEQGAYHDMVCLNAAACLIIAGKVDTFSDGFKMAQDAIAKKEALKILNNYIKKTN